ncbi:hypothetical protein [Alicyclobacillus macrosporangiidus]|uniref:Tetratricopeptide repeat-containing protein n=1 Tax=Alicyclobacillus macrosporangiidus TaxID=392015 RepID=A0A1I7G647_9BACL|nr:hypothetical protein [Alicyclobacillus macrosporangiidus]SFU43903.1 hypothetical protein SAMN05421543_10217 [Alicyclobacillus macrosporangiidus]
MAKAYLNKGLSKRANEILDQITAPAGVNDAMELALLYKRAGDMQKAHNVFASNYDVLMNDPNPTRQAWCWMDLANTLIWLRAPDSDIRRAFEKAIELLPSEPRFKDVYARWQGRAQRNNRKT